MVITLHSRVLRTFVRGSVAAFASSAALVGAAGAATTIKNPGQRVHYTVELEPHLLFAIGDPPGLELDADSGYGFGGRIGIEVAPDGLLPSVNDSAAIGFGADYVEYSGGAYRGECTEWESGPAGTDICVETSAIGGEAGVLLFPAVFQWNFWLTDELSVFAEPGFAITHESGAGMGFAPFVVWGGGRYHFHENVALTLRLGYPSLSGGVSFLF